VCEQQVHGDEKKEGKQKHEGFPPPDIPSLFIIRAYLLKQ
jgi:hypothetical protein